MANAGASLQGWRVLVVEDEYLIATELAQSLEDIGAEIIGPAGTVDEALALMNADVAIDGAVLDINVGTKQVYPVADALRARGVPFVFATGYDGWVVPETYLGIPRCEKPVQIRMIAKLLAGLRTG